MITYEVTSFRNGQLLSQQEASVDAVPLLTLQAQVGELGLTIDTDVTSTSSLGVIRTFEMSESADFLAAFPTPELQERAVSGTLSSVIGKLTNTTCAESITVS